MYRSLNKISLSCLNWNFKKIDQYLLIITNLYVEQKK